MRRPLIGLLAFGLGLTLPAVALAAPPPSLPEDDDPGDGSGAEGEVGGSAGVEAGGGADIDEGETGGGAGVDPFADGSGGGEPDGTSNADLSDPFAGVDDTPPADGGEITTDDLEGGVYDDPGYVDGVRENLANSSRGPIGLFNTSLADVGGKYSTRFYLRSDFFVQNRMFVDSPEFGTDRHSRVRGGVGLGFTFTKWTEAYFAVSGSSNRNERDDPNRQDPDTVFALGDMDFGIKGAWRGVKGGGIGIGGQVGLGLLSGTDRLLTERINFNIDALFTADLRYFTAKQIPLRFTANVGWKLDNSYKLVDFGAIDDIDSREVLRFGLGVEHSRVRTRWAIDAPLHLGKHRQIGIDPIIEYAWDISTQEEQEFAELTDIAGASPLPRTNQWLTIGLRANPWQGLQLEAAVDVGLVSPNYEFGPPTPPYQVTLGIGWSFDPAMRKPPTPPAPMAEPVVLEGRILGTVLDSQGMPIAGAKVTFPGLANNAILTDDAGRFTSYRFPEGTVQINIELADGSLVSVEAAVLPAEETELEIQLEGAGPDAVPESSEWRGTVTGPDGEGVKYTMMVSGSDVSEPFESNDAGKIALLLPVGDYTGVITAPGYKEKSVNFSVVMGEVIRFEDKLEKDAPPETPNVRGGKNSIRIRKKIRYDSSNAPSTRSHGVLDELATFLNFHGEYKLIEIRAYTDDRGNPKSRTQARADAVRDYLISKGVAADRLEAKGKGDASPVAVNITEDGRSKNNRTNFRVKEKAE